MALEFVENYLGFMHDISYYFCHYIVLIIIIFISVVDLITAIINLVLEYYEWKENNSLFVKRLGSHNIYNTIFFFLKKISFKLKIRKIAFCPRILWKKKEELTICQNLKSCQANKNKNKNNNNSIFVKKKYNSWVFSNSTLINVLMVHLTLCWEDFIAVVNFKIVFNIKGSSATTHQCLAKKLLFVINAMIN